MELKLYHTTNSKLQSLPIVGGQLIVSRDDKTLRIDIDDVGRIEITDFIDIETDAQRLAVLAPLPNKYYYVANTNSVWRFISGEWKKINNNTTYTLSSGSINGTIKLVGSDGTEIEVAVKGLGSAAFTDANDYAKKDNALLLEEQTLTESQKIQVKNNLGISALNDVIDTKANASDLSSHTGNKLNPHNVTKSQVGLGNVENKSSATIRGEITKQNVTNALGYTPPMQDTTYNTGTSTQSGLTKLYSGTGTATDGTMTQKAISDAISNADVTPEALIEQNARGLQKVWRGTKAEYNAISTKDNTCLYIVTDDQVSADFEVESNKTTVIDASSTHQQYPSAKAVYDKLANLDSYEQTANKVTTVDLRSTDDTYPSARAVWRLKLDSNQKYTNVTNSLNNKEDTSNKVTTITGTVTDTQYPSALAVYNIMSELLKGVIYNGNTLSVNNGIVTINAPEIFYNTAEPTDIDGKVGDIWVVYEE